MPRTSLAALLCSLTLAGTAQAAVLKESNISSEDAQKLAVATVAACQAKGYNVSASVVDRAGLLKAFARADNAGPHTVEASRAKAFTAASAKNPTLNIMENAQKNPAAANLADIPGFLLLGGGVPVKAGDAVIGAIGVAGAPGGHLDAQCADEVLAANAALFK
ncbi:MULTISPECIES: heme-binding protein [unclassified Pseudomonas]|uniref:GlcG/HbpS family heme-binding protein n=1 Tax=unclassified Pseudomonas TaxID=196821 RepID=UPI00129DEF6E|nr:MULTISPECIES: heme-binding protein [unclassified Pseudomonas]MDH4652684.1 heme-binding protein [Pseudomonas sp. BN606]MRK20479.1 heme-binding protein [Pseudomonas sp. JG-B]